MKDAMRLLGLSLLILWNTILRRAASEQTLYTFTGGNDGGNPYASLIFDSKGKPVRHDCQRWHLRLRYCF